MYTSEFRCITISVLKQLTPKREITMTTSALNNEKEMTMQEALDFLFSHRKPGSPSIFDKCKKDDMDDDFEDTAG